MALSLAMLGVSASRSSWTRARTTARRANGQAGCRTRRRSGRTPSSLERMGAMEGRRTILMSRRRGLCQYHYGRTG